MAGEVKIESPQEEIAMLKKKISELEGLSSGKKEQKDVVAEIIKDHTEKAPQEIFSEGYKLTPEQVQQHVERISNLSSEEDPHQQQILELLQFAQDKGVFNAVSVVKRIGDPHLEDDFHRALVKYLQGIQNV